MPHFPVHPPYLYSLHKKHGDYVNPGGSSSAAESIALGAHTGTHIDALCHFSLNGKLHGGADAKCQAYTAGLSHLSVDTITPIFRRGVLLDIAGCEGVNDLSGDFVISPRHLNRAVESAGVVIQAGDVVLIRTGWGRFWDDAGRFISQLKCPGPGIEAARWLSERGIFAAGSDTAPFEAMPSLEMSVHVHLLVESGIHIMECLNLEELSSAGVAEFLFVAAPLKLRGGTGSPIRPLALIPDE